MKNATCAECGKKLTDEDGFSLCLACEGVEAMEEESRHELDFSTPDFTTMGFPVHPEAGDEGCDEY